MTLNRDKLAEAIAGTIHAHNQIGYTAAVTAVLTEIHAQGYCIVPVTPSEEMCSVAIDSIMTFDPEQEWAGSCAKDIYTAMISQGRER